MKFPISVLVKTDSTEDKFDEENKIVYVKEQARDNKANVAVVKLLSRYFKKQVGIKSGFKSKTKMIELI